VIKEKHKIYMGVKLVFKFQESTIIIVFFKNVLKRRSVNLSEVERLKEHKIGLKYFPPNYGINFKAINIVKPQGIT
jgi:hypothetical protein